MLRRPPSGDPYLTYLVEILNAELFRKEPTILGFRDDGTTLHVRFRAALATPWVQVHVQSTQAGEGGGTYSTTLFTSSTEVDCRANRIQDRTITRVGGVTFYVWLIPVQYDAAGTKVLYNGVGGVSDGMAYLEMTA